MFDSAPPNLPVENTSTPPMVPPPSASVPVPPKPPAPSGKKEPEDIFADLDQSAGLDIADAPQASMPEERSSSKKIIFAVIGAVLVLGIGGASAWYFMFRSKAPAVISEQPPVQTSPIVTAQPEPVVEAPVALPNQPASAPVVTPPPNVPVPQPIENTSSAQPVQITEATDGDRDSLSDAEEAVLGTNASVVDSDGDGYGDGEELRSGYDPASAKLAVTSSPYFHSVAVGKDWGVFLPSSWIVDGTGASTGDYVVQTGTPTSFAIHIDTKSVSATFADWLAVAYPAIDANTLKPLTSKLGYTLWQNVDKTVSFVVRDEEVLVIRYQLNAATEYAYRALYQHIVQTIKYL